MAKRKRSTSAEDPFTPIPTTANIPRDPETLRKVGEGMLDAFAEYERGVAARKAKEAIEKAGKRAQHRVTKRDVDAVKERLGEITLTMLAIQQATLTAIDNQDTAESILTLIRESARSSARAIDACAQRLGMDAAMLWSGDEFERQ